VATGDGDSLRMRNENAKSLGEVPGTVLIDRVTPNTDACADDVRMPFRMRN